MIYLFCYTARAHLCTPRTMLTGMSDFVPVAPVVIRAPVPPSFYCYLCKLSLPTQERLYVHNRSVFHIVRILKMYGLPMVKCVLCCSFALLPEHEHVALPRHVLAAARYPHFRGSPLLVDMHPMFLYTALQFTQLIFYTEYIHVYWAHVRTHASLFTEAQRAFAQARLLELTCDYESPIYSSNEEEDEKQYHTP
jgi:hypothetical protein